MKRDDLTLKDIVVQNELFVVYPYQTKDARFLAEWMSVSQLDLFYLSSSFTFPVSEDTFNDYVAKASSEEGHRFYSVLLKKSNEHIGHFEIKNINMRHNIGTGAHIVLDPKYRKKGWGKPFVHLVSEAGFEALNLDRLSLSVHTENLSAIAAYIRAGYRFEGTIRDVLTFEDKRFSLYQLSLLKTEWQEMRPLQFKNDKFIK